MYIPWGKTFFLVLRSRWSRLSVKVKYQGHICKQGCCKGAFMSQTSISCPQIAVSAISILSSANTFNLDLWYLVMIYLTHYQTTNFRLFQTKKVYRLQFQIWRKWQKVIQTGRKHCGKRRNCSLRAISPFPTVFSKGLFPRDIKRFCCVGIG